MPGAVDDRTMAIGDVLVAAPVGALDGALFGAVAVLCALGLVEFAALPGGGLMLASAFALVWLPVSAYSTYRFQTDKRYVPVVRRYLDLSVRYGGAP